MKRSILFLTVVGSLLVARAGRADDEKTDSKKLQGSWKVVSSEAIVNGEKDPTELFKGAQAVFKGDEMTILEKKQKPKRYKIKLDEKKKPKNIDLTDLTPLPKNKKNKTDFGIYEFEGDSLKLSISLSEKTDERPTDFVGKKGVEILVLVLKRTDTK